jgi:DNA-binding transcriptional regulator YbjK
MAAGHTETVLSLLESWSAVVEGQARALSEGDMAALDDLVGQASRLQDQLQRRFSRYGQPVEDNRVSTLLSQLLTRHSAVVEALAGRCEELSREIGKLGRDMSSIESYKSKEKDTPRLMSRRT